MAGGRPRRGFAMPLPRSPVPAASSGRGYVRFARRPSSSLGRRSLPDAEDSSAAMALNAASPTAGDVRRVDRSALAVGLPGASVDHATAAWGLRPGRLVDDSGEVRRRRPRASAGDRTPRTRGVHRAGCGGRSHAPDRVRDRASVPRCRRTWRPGRRCRARSGRDPISSCPAGRCSR
jgi:hypothetical protein